MVKFSDMETVDLVLCGFLVTSQAALYEHYLANVKRDKNSGEGITVYS